MFKANFWSWIGFLSRTRGGPASQCTSNIDSFKGGFVGRNVYFSLERFIKATEAYRGWRWWGQLLGVGVVCRCY